jgi:hypothetical protein
MGKYRSGYIDKGASQEQVVEILGAIMHNLNEIMNNLSSDNIKSIEFGRTKALGKLELKDSEGRVRFTVGSRGGEFEFKLLNKAGEVVLGIDEDGNLEEG